MTLLDQITVRHGSDPRHIQLFRGDLTEVPLGEESDVLIVSAFPNSYAPLPGTLIGALARKGISMDQLSQEKAADLRPSFSCWLSKELADAPAGIPYRRILCFEPLLRGEPPEVVGDIFQSLMPLVNADPPVTSIAMPLIASGNQSVPLADMLEPLLEAAAHWLALGLPVETIRIVEIDPLKAAELKGAFAILKKRLEDTSLAPTPEYRYDLFISYSHRDTEAVSQLMEELERQRPDLRIFFDRKDLNAGMAWQQTLFEALDDCRKVIAVYSPPYLESKVCKEEFNIAYFRHRDAQEGVLFPIYLYSADLPTYLQLIHFEDCREADPERVRKACRKVVATLEKGRSDQ